MRAFSLFEMILVVFLISLFYMFININFSKLTKKDKENVTLQTIKKYLKKQEYKKTISLQCIEEASRCLVIADGEFQEELQGIFKTTPIVYKYGEQMDVLDFDFIDIDGYRNFHVDFALTLDKEHKHEDILVEVEDKIYYFNPLFTETEEFHYISEVIENFENKISEIQYAF